MRRYLAIAACVLTSFALSTPARGGGIVLGPAQDFKSAENIIDIDIDIETMGTFHVPFDGDFEFTDSLTIHISISLDMLGIGYVESGPGFSGPARVTTIYGVDQNPSGSALQMTGVDPTNPQFSPIGEETLFSPVGTSYVADFAFAAPVGQLATILGSGYDLSPFAAADPNSLVYVFQTNVLGADFLVSSVPEPATLVCGVQAVAMLGGLFIWRRRTGRGNRRSCTSQ